MRSWKPQPTKAVDVLINIRYRYVPVERLTEIFLEKKPYNSEYEQQFLEFFNEVGIPIMLRYMKEQGITREQILKIFYILPQNRGELFDFQRELEDERF